MIGILRVGGIAAISALGALVFTAAFSEKDASSKPVSMTIPVHMLFAPGVVEPRSEEREIAATVVGRLTFVKAEGESVKAGDIVAEIENDDRKAELAAAQARLSIRQEELARLLAGARDEERKEADAALHEVEAQVRLTKSIVDRRLPLARTGFASMETVDHAQADYAAAVARQNLMAQRLALINAPPRREDLVIAQANIAEATAEVADAQALLEMTRLRSPIDGIFLKRYKLPGETVTNLPPTLVATVGDISCLRVRAQIDETDVARIAVGQNVHVTADAFPNRRFSGKVISVGHRLGPKNLKTELPAERVDTKILEAVIDLDGQPPLPVGLRVDVSLDEVAGPAAAADEAPNGVGIEGEHTARSSSVTATAMSDAASSQAALQGGSAQSETAVQPSPPAQEPAVARHMESSEGTAHAAAVQPAGGSK